MKIILLTENATLYSIKRFQKEGEALGRTVELLNPFQGLFPPTAPFPHRTLVLHRTSGYRLDTHDLALSFFLQASGHRVVNDPALLLQWRDKELQYAHLATSPIPCIPTLSLRGPWQNAYHHQIHTLFKDFTAGSGPAFVVKTTIGSGARGVTICHGPQGLKELCQHHFARGDQKYLIQPFLKGAIEWRLFYLKGHLVGGLRKAACPHTLLHNKDQGGSASFCPAEDCPPPLRLYAKQIQELCPFSYAAIDFFSWRDRFFFLEINFVPGFQLFEELSGRNLARQLLTALSKEWDE